MAAKKQQWPYDRLKTVLPDLAVAEYDAIWEDLTSYLGFAANLMPNATNRLRVTQSQQLIVNYCQLFDKDWMEAGVNCKSTLRFRWDQTYQKCYTVRIPQNITKVRKVLLRLYFF